MSALSAKQFTESDFFFLIESFTIFFEKMLSLYDIEGGNIARSHWILFKQKLMDKSSTTSQVFAFANNIKVQPKKQQLPSSSGNNGINSSLQNTPITSSTQKMYQSPQQQNYVQSSQRSPPQKTSSNSKQTQGSPQSLAQTTPYISSNNGTNLNGSRQPSAQPQQQTVYTQQQQQQPTSMVNEPYYSSSNTSSGNSQQNQTNQQQSYREPSYLNPIAQTVPQRPSSYQVTATVTSTRNGEKQTTYTLPSSGQKYPSSQQLDPSLPEPVRKGSEPLKLHGIQAQQKQEEEQNEKRGAQKNNQQSNPSMERSKGRSEQRKNTKLQRQRSRTLSTDQFQAKLNLIEGEGNDEDMVIQNQVTIHGQGNGGYQQRLDQLKTKSPNESRHYIYPSKEENANEDMEENVIERIKPNELLEQRQNINSNGTQQIRSNSKQPQQDACNAQLPQSKQYNSNQDQLAQQQQQQQNQQQLPQQQQNLYPPTQQLPSLSSIKQKKPSFTASRKDELFKKVREGIQLIKKNHTTLHLVYDKSYEIDTTKHDPYQKQMSGDGRFAQLQQYHQGGNRTKALDQSQKKSQNMKKYSIFLKQQQEEEQQQQQQQKTAYQPQGPPQQKAYGQPYDQKQQQQQQYPQKQQQYYNNTILTKLQQVYDNPSQYVKVQYQQKGYHNQGGKVYIQQ